MKLEEENSHYWGNIMRGKDSRKETIGRIQRDRSMVWDPRYQMQ